LLILPVGDEEREVWCAGTGIGVNVLRKDWNHKAEIFIVVETPARFQGMRTGGGIVERRRLMQCLACA